MALFCCVTGPVLPRPWFSAISGQPPFFRKTLGQDSTPNLYGFDGVDTHPSYLSTFKSHIKTSSYSARSGFARSALRRPSWTTQEWIRTIGFLDGGSFGTLDVCFGWKEEAVSCDAGSSISAMLDQVLDWTSIVGLAHHGRRRADGYTDMYRAIESGL